MKAKRLGIRFIFLLIVLLSCCAIAIIIYQKVYDKVESWNVIAASLAVLTAVVSAYTSLRIVENEEDKLRPKIGLLLDIHSRYGCVQLIINNLGGANAYNVDVININRKLPEDNFLITALKDLKIDSLLENECLSIPLGSHIKVFHSEVLIYEIQIAYKDSRKHKYNEILKLDFEKYKGTYLHKDEIIKAGFELQKLPDKMDKLRNEINEINRELSNYIEGSIEYKHYRRKMNRNMRKN